MTGQGAGFDGADGIPSSDEALTLLAQLGQEISADGELPGLVRPLLEMLGELSGLEVVYLTSIDWEAGIQTVEIARNVGTDWSIPEGASHAWHDSLCELSLERDQPWNSDVPGTWGHRAAGRALGIHSFVSVPVEVDTDGPPYGTLCGASPRQVDEDPRVTQVLRLFAQMIATSLQRDNALEQARSRAEYAEERLADRIRFAAQVEHAMKSPITVIKGWSETLRERPGDEEALGLGLEAIESTADRLSAQVSDLLSEARSTIGAGQVEDVDVRRVALGLSKLAPDHPYLVRGSLHLQAEPVAVSVLLEHLVENAVTHTPPGTAIRVILLDDAIVVEDDGPGLPDRDDLFEPFVSADPNVQGTGLGLHIIASIAERLEARLEAGAAESGGARFELRWD